MLFDENPGADCRPARAPQLMLSQHRPGLPRWELATPSDSLTRHESLCRSQDCITLSEAQIIEWWTCLNCHNSGLSLPRWVATPSHSLTGHESLSGLKECDSKCSYYSIIQYYLNSRFGLLRHCDEHRYSFPLWVSRAHPRTHRQLWVIVGVSKYELNLTKNMRVLNKQHSRHKLNHASDSLLASCETRAGVSQLIVASHVSSKLRTGDSRLVSWILWIGTGVQMEEQRY